MPIWSVNDIYRAHGLLQVKLTLENVGKTVVVFVRHRTTAY